MSAPVPQVIVGRCGLVCSHCGAFTRGRCAGCHGDRPLFRCCPVRACARERGCETCADCPEFADLKACRKLNSFIARVFGLIFRSNRIGNLDLIRSLGMDAFKARRGADGRK